MAEFRVAIELGSSKITGIAGRKNTDGSISVLAIAQENGEACIRNGVVRNIEKTVQVGSDAQDTHRTCLRGLWRTVNHGREKHQCQGVVH
mgnify:CR=1 FL=1